MNAIDHKHEFDGKQDRNFHQKPFDEVTDPLPQIDDASATMSERHTETKAEKESGSKSEINEEDVRDQSDSTDDWDAEHNRTGRHK